MIPVLLVLAVLFAAYSVVMFIRKGPLPCFHFLMMTREEKEEVLCPREYRNAGLVMLGLAAGCLIGCVICLYLPSWMTKYLVVLGACAVLYFMSYDLKPKKWEDLPESKIERGGTKDIL